jgi:putative ABC transport system substrate-binding protein
VKRREFITLLGGAAVAWPPAAFAQQPAMPVVGFLGGGSAEKRLVVPFLQGLVPTDAIRTESNVRDVEAAARALGLQIHVFNASTVGEIDATFTAIVRERFDALFVVPDGFFANRRVQLATLAGRYAIPAAYAQRDYVEVGGLMSYGTNLADARRQVGIYTGRVLKGEKPADLPVLQPTRFELVINVTTAKAIGLKVPPTLLARADEVIE